MRLIDADPLIKIASEYDDFMVDGHDILDAPTIDAVPVVRCKDCKFWNRDDPAGNGCECHCNGGWWLPEDYCSCGERRDSDE